MRTVPIKYSFIIIAFNEERSIASCITSILAQEGLGDTYEIIMVNDGSHDRTLDAMQQLAERHSSIQVIDLQPNRGRGAARAAGVQQARGEYFAFIDADIILPANWLTVCAQFIGQYDACGGIAVPDGDVSWLYQMFKLSPKVAPHATKVSGGNGLFKQEIFKRIEFDASRKDGEDVDFGYKLKEHNFAVVSIPHLIVDHRESKGFIQSVRWLFQSGIGASRQFYEHYDVRLPDVAFFGFLFLLCMNILLLPFNHIFLYIGLILSFMYLCASSILHMSAKFHLSATPLRSMGAVAVNMILLASYYMGRIKGLFVHIKNIPVQPRSKNEAAQ